MWQKARIIDGPLTGARVWVECGKPKLEQPYVNGLQLSKPMRVYTVAVGEKPPPRHVMPAANLQLMLEFARTPIYVTIEELRQQVSPAEHQHRPEHIEFMGRFWYIDSTHENRRAAEDAADVARTLLGQEVRPAVVEIEGRWRLLLPAQLLVPEAD